MSYDNDTNRELAKTALAIYAKHSVPQNDGRSNCAVGSLNENVNYNSVPQRTPQTLKEAISNVLLEYSSDVVLLSEQSIGRKLNSNEINNVAGRLLEYINILPPKQQVSLMEELAALYEDDYFQTPTDQSGYVLPAQDARTGGPQTGQRPGRGSAGFNPNPQIFPPTGLPSMEPPFADDGVQMLPGTSPAASGARVGANYDALAGAGRREGVPIRTNTEAGGTQFTQAPYDLTGYGAVRPGARVGNTATRANRRNKGRG